MSRETEALENLRDKIERYLEECTLPHETRPDGRFAVQKGSTVVIISPALSKNLQTVVILTAPVALECRDLTPEVGLFLAQENLKLTFGRFALDMETRSVVCQHVLLGDFLDAEELVTAVRQVVTTADEYDETIAALAGGRRAGD